MKEDDIYFHLANVKYKWATKTNPNLKKRLPTTREGLIEYLKSKTPPILKNKDEIIPHKYWDLPSLVGETELLLFHPSYWNVNEYILRHHQRKHDILTIFECSNAKPYSVSGNIKPFVNRFSGVSDFACISNPGIIPVEYSHFYPYRYDEWDHYKEGEEMKRKYCIANIGRILDYKNRLGYENVIVMMQHPHPQKTFDIMYNDNIENCREWLHIVTNDEFREEAEKEYIPVFKNKGLFIMRLIGTKLVRDKYINTLEKLVKNEDKQCLNELKEMIYKYEDPNQLQNQLAKYYNKKKIKRSFIKDGADYDWKMLCEEDIDMSLFNAYFNYLQQYIDNTQSHFSIMDILLSYYHNPQYIRDIDNKYHTMRYALNKSLINRFDIYKIDSYLFIKSENLPLNETEMFKYFKKLGKAKIIKQIKEKS